MVETIQSPIFIVGAERSGSTLLRLMLDSHPTITGCEGFEFMVDMLGDGGQRPDMAAYRDYLLRHEIFRSTRLTIDPSLDYDALVNDFFGQRLAGSGKPEAAAMVHFGFSRALHIWPEARFIHLIRDPRDVTSSVINMGWASTVWFGLDKWIESEAEWERLQPTLRDDQWMELHFEDLIEDHERELKRICAFLGVDYTSDMLSYADETAYAIPDPTRSSAWQSTLTKKELAIVEGRVGDQLVARGYELSGQAVEHLDGVSFLIDKTKNRIGRAEARRKKFGTALFAASLASKLDPTGRVNEAVRDRMIDSSRSSRKQSWRSDDREYSLAPDSEAA